MLPVKLIVSTLKSLYDETSEAHCVYPSEVSLWPVLHVLFSRYSDVRAVSPVPHVGHEHVPGVCLALQGNVERWLCVAWLPVEPGLTFTSSSCSAGPHVPGADHHVWIRPVRHSAHHWEGREWRQGLHLVSTAGYTEMTALCFQTKRESSSFKWFLSAVQKPVGLVVQIPNEETQVLFV